MKRILLILALVVSAGSVDALTQSIGTRSITAEYTDVAGQIVATDTDSETVFDDAPYTRALSATIGGGGYNATIGMSSLGFFGIDALTFVGGRLETRVLSLETYENDTAVPVDLEASFLVVEGLLQLVAATGGTLTLDIQSGEFPFGDFRGIGQLDSVDFVSTYTESGDPLGGTQAFPGSGVSVPFKQNVIDLGRVEPGESFNFLYALTIAADADLMEIARWEFFDPTDIAGQGSSFVLSATPAGVSAIPAPASAGLLAGAMAIFLAAFRRRKVRGA